MLKYDDGLWLVSIAALLLHCTSKFMTLCCQVDLKQEQQRHAIAVLRSAEILYFVLTQA